MTQLPATSAPTVIVLAAGQGQRFRLSGGGMHKLDAPLNGLSVLQRVLQAVAASGLPYHVVRPEQDVEGDAPGMGDSIARGVRATAQATGWLILPGDLPLVTSDSLCQVALNLVSHPVVVPRWNGQPGHPVGFGAACFAALTALRGDTGAASIVRVHRQAGTLLTLHLDDPGIATDIDTLDDLARAEALLAACHS
ncbi:nucleotidyltransferase family protein [Castellaniella sp.]|uniref:nucleotidyltransferase family protein n=1 Tax=Castellaniella sp. TaxID=1955812 RepID=UPI002AFE13F4|nr:nucleotidyltransferase family protein [Castellaniella sp.]